MVRNIEELLAKDDLDRLLVIVGRNHVPGIRWLLETRNGFRTVSLDNALPAAVDVPVH